MQPLFTNLDMGGLTYHHEFAVDRGFSYEVLSITKSPSAVPINLESREQ